MKPTDWLTMTDLVRIAQSARQRGHFGIRTRMLQDRISLSRLARGAYACNVESKLRMLDPQFNLCDRSTKT